MIGSRLRTGRVAVVAALVVTSILCGTAVPAQAGNSATGILSNAWIITDLGGDVLSQQAQLSPYEKSLATTATTATVATSGLTAKPKAGGSLGMVLNTVAVLGGLAGFAFGGGDDEPALPAPPPTPNMSGSSTVGWSNLGIIEQGPSGVTARRQYYPAIPAGYWLYRRTLDTTNGQCIGNGGTYPQCNWSSALGESTPAGYSDSWFGQTNYNNLIEFRLQPYTGVVPSRTVARTHYSIVPKSGTTMANPEPGETTTDPATLPRYVDSFANCKTPGGGTQTITNRVGPFYVVPGQPWSTPEVPDLTCPTGTFLESGGRDLVTTGVTDKHPLQEPYTAPAWIEDQMVKFPNCYPATETQCVLRVERVHPAPAVDCHAYLPGASNPCVDWWDNPQRSTIYKCSYGGQAVAMRRCKPYAQTFNDGTVAPSDPNPDEDISDPASGADPTPDQTPNLGDCVPNWSLEMLNPWWVFKGAACALSWAFVPQVALETRLADVRTELEVRVPFVWFDGFLTIPAAVPDGGCPNWRVKIPGPGGSTALDQNVVCESSYTDALRAARPVLLVFMASLAFWPMVRSIAYASFPVLKPVPGGGR